MPQSADATAIASALWDSADFAGAEPHFRRAIEENAADMDALHGLGRLKLAQNELAAALLLLEQAHALSMNLAGGGRDELSFRIRRDLAWALYRVERFDLAAEQFELLPGQGSLAAQLRAFGTTQPYGLPADAEEIAMPFLGTDPLPIITLSIGGKEHAFVIDTGSGQLVLDTGIARGMGLPSYGIREATFASGQRAPIDHTILPTVTLGDVTIQHVPAEVMDVRRFAPQLSGFIGTSFLWRFHLLFDWEGQVLRLRPRRNGTPFQPTTPGVPFWLFDSHLMLALARLNDHETVAYVASGMAGGAFTVPESTQHQAGLRSLEGSIQGVGAGGATEILLVEADTLCLGDWCRLNQEGFAGFFPAELEWRYGFRVGALVSHAFLHSRRWTVDFDAMRFHFD